ncbi:MAG TPA: hypothetical protein VG602_09330, partial [Actinomycetota bacterium]|nr:hypothetical protein [Actinomycetota bacterium]
MSFEEALTDPLLASLRAGGGVGLMTTLRGEERGRAAYLSIAAGRTASRAPTRFGGILFLQDQGLLLDDDPIPPPRRPIGIGSILRRAGRTVGYLDMGSALGHPAMLVAADRQGRIPVAFLNEFAVLGSLSEAILGNQAKRVLDTADLVVSPGLRSLRFALDTTPAEEVLVLVVAPSASGEMRARGDLVTPLLMDQGSPQDVLSGAGSSGLT